MNFQFSEEQQLLADSVQRLLDEQYHFDARKKIIASDEGWSPSIYAKLSELGLTALPFAVSWWFWRGRARYDSCHASTGQGLIA